MYSGVVEVGRLDPQAVVLLLLFGMICEQIVNVSSFLKLKPSSLDLSLSYASLSCPAVRRAHHAALKNGDTITWQGQSGPNRSWKRKMRWRPWILQTVDIQRAMLKRCMLIQA